MKKNGQVFKKYSKQDFIVLIRVNQSISDLVKRGFNLNGTLQFRFWSLNKQLRQWSFVCVVFSLLQLTPFFRKLSCSIVTVTMVKF